MADKDDGKKDRKPRARPAGARPFAKQGEGRPGFAGKPRVAAGKKPFAKRPDEAGGEGRERPKRGFKAPGGDGKPGGFKGGRPYARPADRGEQGAEGRERPKRDFKAPDGDRKPGGFKDRGSKPFEKRTERTEAGGERPARTFEKRERPEGDRKPFQKRDRPASDPRAERREGKPSGGAARSESPRRPAAKDARPSTRSTRPAAIRPLAEGEGSGSDERIAKRLARAGIASRRDAEALIADGRVKVNGVVLKSPAFNVSASDRIELDSVEIPPVERTRLFLFHKPAGVVTTNRDPEGRRTVFDVLPKDLPRLVTIGRLDISTEGLLLLTNDGGLARLLELPATGWLRRYRVRVHGKVEEAALAELKNGIAVDGVFYGGIEATLDREQGTNAWLTISLREGKNREVKNVLGSLGLDVTRLIRVSYGPFQLGELAEGAVQELKGRMLRDQLGERLIEEAGANFDAPVVTPFSNKPVRDREEPQERGEKPRIVRDGIQGRVGDGGLIKQRRRDRGDERASVLSRLTTKPDKKRPFAKSDKGKPFEKGGKDKPFVKGEKPGDRAEPARTSNVWMAPGARPQGKKNAGAFSPLEGERAAKRPEGVGKGSAKRKGKSSAAEATPPGRSAATLPSRGREGGAPRGKGKGGADRRR